MSAASIGRDLATSVFRFTVIDIHGKVVTRRLLRDAALASLPPWRRAWGPRGVCGIHTSGSAELSDLATGRLITLKREKVIEMTEFPMPTRKRVILMRHGEVHYFDVDGRLVDPADSHADGERKGAGRGGGEHAHRLPFRPCALLLRAAYAGNSGVSPGGNTARRFLLQSIQELREVPGGLFSGRCRRRTWTRS